MEFWRSCWALHFEGLSSQRPKLWRMLAGSWLSLTQSGPFPSVASIHFAEFQASLLALVYPPGLMEIKEWCFLLPLLGFLRLFFFLMGFSIFHFNFFLNLKLWGIPSLLEKLSSPHCFHPFHGNVVFVLHGPTQDTCPSWSPPWPSGWRHFFPSGNLLNH